MTTKQREAIIRHGNNLLGIFPDARENDPLVLCKKLRRLESEGAALGLRLCNGPDYPEDEADILEGRIMDKTRGLLFGNKRLDNVPIFLNLDPRGYALKIEDGWMREHNATLHRDMGGYGIIAPEIGKDGE